MKEEAAPTKAVYEKPAIQELGKFAQLTLGNKSHALSDLSHGIQSGGGGIGS